MPGTDARDPRERLKEVMEARQRQLRLTWREIADRAGMVEQNLLKIRKGHIGITWKAETGIEDALQWERGTIQAILDNEDPLTDGPERAEPPEESVPEPAHAESPTAQLVGSDEWIKRYAEYPEAVKLGLDIRQKRRELEGLLALAAELEKRITEGSGPRTLQAVT